MSTQSSFLPMELPLMSLQEASLVKTSAQQESKLALKPNDPVYGPNSAELLAMLDPNTQSWRTSQTCLVALANNEADGLGVFSETWPRSGMMRNGIAYRLPPLVPLTGEIGLGLLPTPRANDAHKRGNFNIEEPRNGFPAAVKRVFLPTISKNEFKGASRDRYRGGGAFSWCQNVRRAEELRGRSDIPEPLFCGSRDGIPNWVERLEGCGNAVVPQIPELIGYAILDVDAARTAEAAE